MNKNRHRIIFNAARSQRMVVAESAGSVGGSACGETSAPGSAVVSLGDLDICKPSPLRDLALHPLTLSIALALTLGLVFVTTRTQRAMAVARAASWPAPPPSSPRACWTTPTARC